MPCLQLPLFTVYTADCDRCGLFMIASAEGGSFYRPRHVRLTLLTVESDSIMRCWSVQVAWYVV